MSTAPPLASEDADVAMIRETLLDQYNDALNPLYPAEAFSALDRLAKRVQEAQSPWGNGVTTEGAS